MAELYSQGVPVDLLAEGEDGECLVDVDAQVRLLNVENCIPGIEALVDKGIEVLGQAQLLENIFNFLRHAAGLCTLTR